MTHLSVSNISSANTQSNSGETQVTEIKVNSDHLGSVSIASSTDPAVAKCANNGTLFASNQNKQVPRVLQLVSEGKLHFGRSALAAPSKSRFLSHKTESEIVQAAQSLEVEMPALIQGDAFRENLAPDEISEPSIATPEPTPSLLLGSPSNNMVRLESQPDTVVTVSHCATDAKPVEQKWNRKIWNRLKGLWKHIVDFFAPKNEKQSMHIPSPLHIPQRAALFNPETVKYGALLSYIDPQKISHEKFSRLFGEYEKAWNSKEPTEIHKQFTRLDGNLNAIIGDVCRINAALEDQERFFEIDGLKMRDQFRVDLKACMERLKAIEINGNSYMGWPHRGDQLGIFKSSTDIEEAYRRKEKVLEFLEQYALSIEMLRNEISKMRTENVPFGENFSEAETQMMGKEKAFVKAKDSKPI